MAQYSTEGLTTVLRILPILDESSNSEDSPLVLIVPGNPGLVGVYETFATRLFEQLDSSWAVWALSHQGHTLPGANNFDLDEQIAHKVNFVRGHLSKTRKIVLIGHSIGALICLKILEELKDFNICKAVLLFPTIERMAESPKGVVMTPSLKYGRWALVFITHLLSYLPTSFAYGIIRAYLRMHGHRSVSEQTVQALLPIIQPRCISNVLFMAHKEMQEVCDPPIELLEKHWHKLIFYYGATDGWCPVKYHDDMIARSASFPDGNKAEIHLCRRGISHEFVLKSSVEMADIVANWIRPLGEL